MQASTDTAKLENAFTAESLRQASGYQNTGALATKVYAPQYVLQASPLTKLYMSEWTQKCLENPELLVNPEASFSVRVPRDCGGIVLKHNEPTPINRLIPVTGLRELLFDEITPLVQWLTGGPDGLQSLETDIYGVVGLEVNLDIGGDLLSIAKLKTAAKQLEELHKTLIGNLSKSIEKAREIADQRVKRAMKQTYNNVIRQWEILREEGKGVYQPSIAEAMSAFVLDSEIKKSNELRQSALQKLMDAMKMPNA